jgi:molecular chaperone GrpE
MTEPIDEEALLDQFRQWMREARTGVMGDGPPSSEIADEVGLYRLVEEFTALRHEVKLQTKGSRGLQEQAEALLPALKQAIEQFRAVEPREAQAAWVAGKPLAEALADLDEALARGSLQLEKASHRIVDEAQVELADALNALHAGQSWLRRRWTRSYHEAVSEVVRRNGPAARRPLFDALLEGYGLIQTRLHRTMGAEQVRRIETVGQPVNPGLMTVIEVVDDPSRASAEVVDEVRTGYTWRGRVLRYAEVRAARSQATSHDEQLESDD